MKVAILGQYPFNPGKIRGGVETCMIGLVNGLKKYPDTEIHVIATQIMWKDITKNEASRLIQEKKEKDEDPQDW